VSKVARIATTEYLNAVRSKAFIIGVILMPVMMGGGLIANVLAERSVDLRERKFAVLDESGRMYARLAAAIEERNEGIFETEGASAGSPLQPTVPVGPGRSDRSADGSPPEPATRRQVRPRFGIERYEHDPSEQRGPELVLSDRVRDDDLFAFLVIGEDAYDAKRSADDVVSYYSDSPTYDDLPNWIRSWVQKEVESARFEVAGLDEKLVDDLTRPVRFKDRGLVAETAAGEVVGGEEEDEFQTKGIPIISMFLLFMLVMMSAPQALNVVLEEKMQKISEVLVSSVTPFQLMMGKLLGTVMVSMTLSVLYLGAVYLSADHFEVGDKIPLHFYGWFVFFQIMALAIFTSLFSAIGAACSEMRDAQSLMTPAMILVLIPMFFWLVVLKSPDGPMSVALSLFPPATPMLMMMRVAIPPGPPLWQLVLAVVLTVGFTCLCVWAAGKVFRVGLLSTGQAPTLRRLAGWVFSK
jgi:ABC-2 type transport system permease protein